MIELRIIIKDSRTYLRRLQIYKNATILDRVYRRIIRLIVCNLIDKALELITQYNIDINCNLSEEIDDTFLARSIYPARCFISVAILYSSMFSIKRLIKAGADPFINIKVHESNWCEFDQIDAFSIPILTQISNAKISKELYWLSAGIIDRVNNVEPYARKVTRYSNLNKLIQMKPISCNAYGYTQHEKCQMLHKNISPNRILVPPSEAKLKRMYKLGTLKYDELFRDFFYKYLKNIEII